MIDQPQAEVIVADANTGEEIGTVVHLVLEDPRELDDPIPCIGRLGLWTPDDEALDMLEVAL